MAATVSTHIYTGVATGGVAANDNALPSNNLRFSTSDEYNPGSNNPIPIPSTGTYYSFAKSIAFYVDTAPDTSITGIYIYTDGALGWGAGVTVYVGDQYPTNYVQATGTTGTTGNEITTFYTGITSVANLFGYTSGSPKGTIDQVATSGTGRYTKYVVLQEYVTNAASSGAKTPETLTWRYNEV